MELTIEPQSVRASHQRAYAWLVRKTTRSEMKPIIVVWIRSSAKVGIGYEISIQVTSETCRFQARGAGRGYASVRARSAGGARGGAGARARAHQDHDEDEDGRRHPLPRREQRLDPLLGVEEHRRILEHVLARLHALREELGPDLPLRDLENRLRRRQRAEEDEGRLGVGGADAVEQRVLARLPARGLIERTRGRGEAEGAEHAAWHRAQLSRP